jgi:hypothetical protein
MKTILRFLESAALVLIGACAGYSVAASRSVQPTVMTEAQVRCEKAVAISRKIVPTNSANLIFVAAEAAHEQIIAQSEFLAVKRRLETPGEDLNKLANDIDFRLLGCVPVAQPYRPIQ